MTTTNINDYDINEIIDYISFYLLNILTYNKENRSKLPIDENSYFFSDKIPIITIKEFFERLYKFSKISNSTFIIIIIYIKRYIKKLNFVIALNNLYKLIITCTVLAKKYNEDSPLKNRFFAKIGGVNIEELNYLEYKLFVDLDYYISVSEEEYLDIVNEIKTFYIGQNIGED